MSKAIRDCISHIVRRPAYLPHSIGPSHASRQARPALGFSTPYNGTDAVLPETLRRLDGFYAHANRELCSLVASLSAAGT